MTHRLRFTHHYKSILSYLKSNRKLCLFVALGITEFFIFACLNTPPNNYYTEYVTGTAGAYNNAFSFVFFENLKTAIMTILWGTIPFGIFTLLGTFGVITTLVSTFKLLITEIIWWKLLVCMIPHGIIEIPAMCFSILLSVIWCMSITMAIIRLVRRKPVIEKLKTDCIFILESIIFVLVPMVLVAAIIETTLSARIVALIL